MAAKVKGKQAPKTIPHKDHYARISYLYQASHHFALNPKYDILSRSLARNLDLVSKKTVLKLLPELKRSLCKKCHTLMIPGINEGIFIENKSKSQSPQNDILVHQCKQCGEMKRFPVGRDREYQLFSEREDVQIDVE